MREEHRSESPQQRYNQAREQRREAAREKRWWRDDKPLPDDEPLPYVDITAPLIDREWLVVDRVPMFNVTSLFGEGAVGKSIVLLQLSAAVVLGGKYWLGALPANGAALYYCAEEDAGEINRRLEAVARYYNSSRQQMRDRGLRVLSFAGRDAILGQPDNKTHIIRPTKLFERIKREAIALKPKLIVIDPVADAFAGNEIDRTHARQFVTLMRGLAIDSQSAVIMAAHPSLTGINTGSGLSGSTAWHNSVRGRMYFRSAKEDEDDDEADPTLRVLEVKKNQYGPPSEAILVRWQEGVFVTVDGGGTFEQLAAEAEIDHLFLKLLRRFTEQHRNVSDKKGPTYAPTEFADTPEAKQAKVKKQALVEAMARLFAANKIRIVTEGSPSRQRSRIVEASNTPSNTLPTPSNTVSEDASNTPSNTPSNAFQHLPTGCARTPPYTPTPVGRGVGGVGNPHPLLPTGGQEGYRARERPSFGGASVGDLIQWESGGVPQFKPLKRVRFVSEDGKWVGVEGSQTGIPMNEVIVEQREAEQPPNAASQLEALGRVLREWRAAYGIGTTVPIDALVGVDHAGLRESLLAVAAKDDGTTVSNIRLARWLRDFNEVATDRLLLRYSGLSEGQQLWTLLADEVLVTADEGKSE